MSKAKDKRIEEQLKKIVALQGIIKDHQTDDDVVRDILDDLNDTIREKENQIKDLLFDYHNLRLLWNERKGCGCSNCDCDGLPF